MNRQSARAVLVAILLCTSTGCTSPSDGRWHKAGADPPTIARDSAECRQAAQEGALRRYPYRASSPTLGPAGVAFGQQRDDNDRAVAEASLFNTCMQDRGYKR